MKSKFRSLSPAEYYDILSDFYDDLYIDDQCDDTVNRAERRIVEQAFHKALDHIQVETIQMLDLGCGTGRSLDFLKSYCESHRKSYRYVGIDISRGMLVAAERLRSCAQASLAVGPKST
jgi:ubiquinone/menaquinone biosynthesis C-methylase UbiE